MSDLLLGITMGDPAGIGPEIIAATLQARQEYAYRVIIFGDADMLARTSLMSMPCQVIAVSTLGEDMIAGMPNDATRRAQMAYLEMATKAALHREIAGLVTAPMCKSGAQKVGFEFQGHTDYLAECFGVTDVVMMFLGASINVALVTTHIPLAMVSQHLSIARVVNTINKVSSFLCRTIEKPRIGVLGLNPHAGEQGLFGDDEARVIIPGINQAKQENQTCVIEGPLVPDVAFRFTDKYDAFVAMYHDQALIPLKLLDFDSAVNLTLGLPIVRTSPDHGVGYDIAGKGIARPHSFTAAFDLAIQIIDDDNAVQ